MDERDICDILINYIDSVLSSKLKILMEKESKHLKRMQELTEIETKLLKLEATHFNDLKKIFAFDNYKFYPFNDKYLAAPLEEVSNQISIEKTTFNDFREKLGIFEDEKVFLTYQDFQDETGLNQYSIKRYLNIMVARGELKRERIIFGYLYSINSSEGDEYAEAAEL